MVRDLLDYRALLKDLHDPFRMEANGLRQLILHERTFGIPREHHLILCCIPHQGQWIELAVERALLVDATGTALTFKGRTHKTFALRIRHDGNLTAIAIMEDFDLQTMIDRP